MIFKSSDEVKSAYLRALYDDEGCAALRINNKTKEWKRNITLSSNSLTLLNDVKLLLAEREIDTNKIIRNKPFSYYDKSFVLSITGKKNIIKFRDTIRFLIPYKQKRVNLMIESYGKTFFRNHREFLKIKEKLDLIPVPSFKKDSYCVSRT